MKTEEKDEDEDEESESKELEELKLEFDDVDDITPSGGGSTKSLVSTGLKISSSASSRRESVAVQLQKVQRALEKNFHVS